MAATRKTRSGVVALPGRRPAALLSLVRFLPSGRSLLIGFALVALAAGGYLGARQTSVFAVQEVKVSGRPEPLQASMQVDASVLLDKRPLYQWLVQPLYDHRGM